MSYFIAIKGPFGRKPMGRTIYPTKQEAEDKARFLSFHSNWSQEFEAMDADHEPGKSLLRNRHEWLSG